MVTSGFGVVVVAVLAICLGRTKARAVSILAVFHDLIAREAARDWGTMALWKRVVVGFMLIVCFHIARSSIH